MQQSAYLNLKSFYRFEFSPRNQVFRELLWRPTKARSDSCLTDLIA